MNLMDITQDQRSPLVRRVVERIDASVVGMTEAQMTWHPEGKWSTAEIIEHLSLAFLVTVKAGRFVLRQGSPQIRGSTFLERVMVTLAIDLGYFFMRLKAPRMVAPRGMAPEEARKAMLQSLTDMDEVLRQCEEKFGAGRPFLPHPFLGPLTVAQWRKFHVVHTRHHMKQVKVLRGKMKSLALAENASAAEIRTPSG
jgi:hypothetical protein